MLRWITIAEEKNDLTKKIRQVTGAFSELKEFLSNHFKDNTVEFKDWRLGLSKTDEEHIVEINMKLSIKKKEIKK